MNPLLKAPLSRQRGAALIIVLALVVLFTGLAVAYLSRTTSDRQVAHSSFNQSSVDQLAQSAMDNVIGDLRQEITNGSASPAPTFSANGSTFNLYVPTSNLNIVPMRSPMPTPGTTPALANLIRRSASTDPALWPDPAVGPARGSRASAVNSTAHASVNGRSVSLARWNSHYMIPKSNICGAGSDPITTGYSALNYWAPDWVFVNDQGATVITAPDTSVIGRYAYMIYDEGGLLDMNTAGYPSPTTILQYGRSGSLAFVDLTAFPTPTPSCSPSPTPGPLLSQAQIDQVVGWRNYASSQPTGTLGSFSFSTNATNTYYDFILSDPNNIQLTNYFTGSALSYFTNSFLTTSQAPVFNTQTDQALAARQLLIKLGSAVTTGVSFSNALQYLGTFSREALAKIPQWSPITPDSTNPNFQTLLVTNPFTRNDGTAASVGEYLVNRRFLLQRLNWLTYKGPSATVANGGTRNAVPASAPAIGNPDYDLWLLTRSASDGITFGLTAKFLQDPVVGGTAANILKYFGLVWQDATNQPDPAQRERWNYVGHSGGNSPASTIATLNTLTGAREPDFFELLQAGIILPSSVDDDYYSPDSTLLPVDHQKSKTLHILTIGANLIAQTRADSYPVRIACTVNVGGTPKVMEAVGCPRLPYLNSLAVCPVAGTATSGLATGGVNWLLVPNLWDPFRDSWDLTEEHASNDTNANHQDNVWLTPGYLRPPVRITVTGSVGLGTVLAGPSITTGIVSSALVTPSPSPIAVLNISPAQSLVLSTPTASPGLGRNGFLEASRISTSDVTPAPPAFTTTTSVSPTPVGQWVNVPYPSPTGAPTPVGNNVVFSISFPGTSIPAGWTSPSQNPVLVLQPGFQITVDYQSPNGTWYSYSFLQGNNEPSTWISASNASNPGVNLTTTWSVYGRNPFPSPTPVTTPFPTILLTSPSPTAAPATLWAVTTLADAPMFAKADPRSIRYNSQVGVIHIASPAPTASPTASPFTAGIIRSLWPAGFAAPPIMTVGVSPAPTPTVTPTPTVSPTPNYNPAIYSQSPYLSDNAAASSNPYSEATPASETDFTHNDPVRPVMMNRPFRSVGEMGYAFRDQPFRTLSFSSANSPDAGLLDLFSVNDYTDSSGTRGGVISLNSRQAPALAGGLTSTIRREDTARVKIPGPAQSPSPSPLASPAANSVATSLTQSTISTPLVNRAGLATLIANETGLGPTVPKTQRESIARALGEVDQTRTWNLFIDVIAQTGRYPPNTPLTTQGFKNGFVVNGEQRYWVHVAIDRFTGQVIDKQIEVVNE